MLEGILNFLTQSKYVHSPYSKGLHREIAQHSRTQINILIGLVEYINDTDPRKTLYNTVYAASIRASIACLCYIFNKQEEHKTLNAKQAKLAAHYNLLQQLLKQAKVIRNTPSAKSVSSLWETLKSTIALRNTYGNFEMNQVG